jgi:cold shock CspA family protein
VEIQGWKADRGFGFVQTQEGRAFLHTTAIRPAPPRGADLNGRELVNVQTETGPKGVRVKSAELTVLRTKWGFTHKSLYFEGTHFEGTSLKTLKRIEVVGEEPREKGSFLVGPRRTILDVGNLREAQALGCPDEVLAEAVSSYRYDNAKYWQRVRWDRALEDAKANTKSLVEAGLPEDKKILIFLVAKPGPTQWINKESIALFDQLWAEFLSRVEVVGSNDIFQWAIVPSDESFDIIAKVGYSHMNFTFRHIVASGKWEDYVFFGNLSCGEGSPASAGPFDMVGRNPNDPEFRNSY